MLFLIIKYNAFKIECSKTLVIVLIEHWKLQLLLHFSVATTVAAFLCNWYVVYFLEIKMYIS